MIEITKKGSRYGEVVHNQISYLQLAFCTDIYQPLSEIVLFVMGMYHVEALQCGRQTRRDWGSGQVVHSLHFS